jgi:hypothetical protein
MDPRLRTYALDFRVFSILIWCLGHVRYIVFLISFADTPNDVTQEAGTSNRPSEELPAAQVLPILTSTSSSDPEVPSGSTPSSSVDREEDQNRLRPFQIFQKLFL